MPAPPEIRDGIRGVGVQEILWRPEAEDAPQADGHIAVTGEIEVDLHQVGQSPQPAQGEAQRRAGAENRVRDLGGGSGQDQLFSKADDETAKALPQVLPAPLTLPQLAAEFRESGDGAGGELGEKGDIQQQPEKAAGAAGRVPPGIHDVGDALEGEEGDAQGRGEAQAGPAGLRQGKHQGEEKAEILEGPQKRQVQNNGGSRQGLAPLWTAEDQQPENIVSKSGGQKQAEPAQAPEGAKKEAEDQQQHVPAPAAPDQVIQGGGQGQEAKQEKGAVQTQGALSFPTGFLPGSLPAEQTCLQQHTAPIYEYIL